MKRILIYSHDTYGLGNIRRMLEITRHLVDTDPALSVLIVTGSPMIQAFRIPERVDYIKLPCVSRSEHGEAGVKTLGLNYQATIRMRANMILMAALDFAPDVVLIDKKPLGIDDELEPMLETLRRGHNPPRTALLLRDILDHPQRTTRQWDKGGYHDAITRYYDRILVVGDSAVFNVEREYRFPPASAAKVRYCGYLARPGAHATAQQMRQELGVGAREPLVLVTAGGGADGYTLMSTHMRSLCGRPTPPPFRTLMISGPEMAVSLRAELRAQAQQMPSVIFREFTSDMLGCMNAADVVVAMGGYNTVCELLTLRKAAVVVPRVEPSLEQWVRAERMHALNLLHAIHPDQLEPQRLLNAISQQLHPSPARQTVLARFAMTGLRGVQDEMAELLDEADDHVPLIADADRAAAQGLTLDTALQALTRGFAQGRLGGGPAFAL